MSDFINLLGKDLYKGFVDKATKAIGDYQPKLLLNSEERTVLDDLQRDLQNCDEFWFSVAFLTTDGLAALIETLKELGQKGVQGKVLVSEYLHFTKPEALRKLLKLENIESNINLVSPVEEEYEADVRELEINLHNKELENKKIEVLVENKLENQNKYFGRTKHMIPVIFESNHCKSGELISVKVTSVNQSNLFGVHQDNKTKAA